MLGQSPRAIEPRTSVPEYDVLIVEDDDLIREELATLLRSQSRTVAVARDGREALECLQRTRVGVVLLDLMLPVMSGWELAAAMRQEPNLACVPILTITAVAYAHRAPPGPVFLKPLNVESLLRGTARALGEPPPRA
jgi:two-component system response regulator CpxR